MNHLNKSLTMSQHAGAKSAEINDKIREAKIDENRVVATDTRHRVSVIDENVTRLNMRMSNIEMLLGTSANAMISYLESVTSNDGTPPIRADHVAAAREAVQFFNMATYTQSEEERSDQKWCKERRDAAVNSLRETMTRVNPEVVPEILANRQRMAPEYTSDFQHPRTNYEKGATAVEQAEASGEWKVVKIECKKFANSASKTGGGNSEPKPSCSKTSTKPKSRSKPEIPENQEDDYVLTGNVSDFTSESGSDFSEVQPRTVPPRKAKMKGKIDPEGLSKAIGETRQCLFEKKRRDEELERERKSREERAKRVEEFKAKKAEQAKKAEEEKARKAEETRKAEEEQARLAEENRKREADKAKQAEELKRRTEAKRKAEEKLRAEELRKAKEQRLLDDAIKTAEALKAVRSDNAIKTSMEVKKRSDAKRSMEAKKAHAEKKTSEEKPIPEERKSTHKTSEERKTIHKTPINRERVAEIRKSMVERVREKDAKKKQKTSYDGWEISSKKKNSSAPRKEDERRESRTDKVEMSKRKRDPSKTPDPPAKRPNGPTTREDKDDEDGATPSGSGMSSSRRVSVVQSDNARSSSGNNNDRTVTKSNQGNKRSRSGSGSGRGHSPSPKASRMHFSPSPGPSGRKTGNLIVQVDNIAADDYTQEAIDKRRELIALLQDQTDQIAQTKRAINAETIAAAKQYHYEGVIRAMAKRESLESRESDLRDTLEERRMDLRTVLNKKRESLGGIPFDLDEEFEIKREVIDTSEPVRYDNLQAASLETAIAMSKVTSPSVTGVTSIEGSETEGPRGFLIKSVTGEKRRNEARKSVDEALYPQPVVIIETMSPEVIKAYNLQDSLGGCMEMSENNEDMPSSPLFETTDEDEADEEEEEEAEPVELPIESHVEDDPTKRAVSRLTKLIEEIRSKERIQTNDHNDLEDQDEQEADSSSDSRLVIDTSVGNSEAEGVYVGQVKDEDEGSEAE